MNISSIILLLFFSPLLAGILMLLFKKTFDRHIKIMLSFSASFLLAVCLIHLLPEIFNSGYNPGIYILLGFFIQIILEYFSSGIEHGHIHHQKKHTFPTLIFISLFLHSFLEGFPLADNTLNSIGEVHVPPLLTGILIHKIPIAIVLTALFINAGFTRLVILFSLTIFALSAPLGVLTVDFFNLHDAPEVSANLTAITIGIFLHISTVILFESNENHHFNRNKFISIILGAVLALAIFGTH